MAFERKFKVAINDNRLVILGAQVLFGFQFNGVFQEMFRELPALSDITDILLSDLHGAFHDSVLRNRNAALQKKRVQQCSTPCDLPQLDSLQISCSLLRSQRNMSNTSINDPKHWRDRAAEMRTLAETMQEAETIAIMRRLADDYDKLADRAALRSNRGITLDGK